MKLLNNFILKIFYIQAKLKIALGKNLAPLNNTKNLTHSLVNTDWLELKNNCNEANSTAESVLYDQLLKKFDPDLPIPKIEEAVFSGSGVGADSLNTFRIVKHQGQTLFEKVYLKSALSVKKLQLFSQFIYPQTSAQDIKTPKIFQITCGNRLCIVYFEYIKSRLDNYDNFLDQAIKISLKLNEISSFDRDLNTEDFSIENHRLYQGAYQQAHALLESQGFDVIQLEKIKQSIHDGSKRFSHGDLHGKNLGKPNIVIDWDEWGFYPLGFDIAVAMSKSLSLASTKHFNFFLETQIKPLVTNANEWPDLRRGITYFCLVFYSRKIGEKINFPTWIELFHLLIYEHSH